MGSFCNNEIYNAVKVFTRLGLLVREMFFLTDEEKKELIKYIADKSEEYFSTKETKSNEKGKG